MQIASGFLFSTIFLLLLPIGMISSEPKTLKDLFPGYNGVMPPVEEIQFENQFRNFRTFGDKHMGPIEKMFLFKRDHIIFGWSWEGSLIRKPCDLFTNLGNIFIAFDMKQDKWVTLPRDLSRKLGTRRDYALLVARDEVAATHKLISNNSIYKEAHMRSCRQANLRVDTVEKEQLELLKEGETTVENSIRAIKKEYSRAYTREFTLYLYQHGEYNINGQKERRI